ncbi:hypothetical protein MTO96_006213 [Rhipicephalus appendiculatus]
MKKAPSRCSLHDKAPFFSLLSPPGARAAEGGDDDAHSSARLLVRKMPLSDFVLRSTAALEEQRNWRSPALQRVYAAVRVYTLSVKLQCRVGVR